MRKKSGFTIVEQAIMLVPEFENVVRKLEQQLTLRGQSKSTLNNYIRRTVHSLRYSYATHLLEQGVNIVTLKEQLSNYFISPISKFNS
jgi:site-specific recombinase XerD